ncbi:MAG: glycoside hydrolase family 172 protein [Ginsengibacter sp.]
MQVPAFKKVATLFQLFLCIASIAYSQTNFSVGIKQETISLNQQLRAFYDIAKLPQYLTNTIEAQTSTYDTTGGNNDGFNGNYSFIRKDADSNLVIFDMNGPGVINRIWTPTPTNDTLDFYIDDTLHAAFSIKYSDLFSNKVFPFVNPLCGNELGGYYCYLPIPFQTHCKIICRARKTQFHQIQYRLYTKGTTVEKFSNHLNIEEKASLKKIAELWNKKAHDIQDFYESNINFIRSSKAITLSPGQEATIFNTTQGGRIVEINFDNADSFEGLQKLIDIKITWDDEHIPAVYCPLADFFGYAFGKISMKSLLLGTLNNENYSYLPMPFDKSARIELLYRKTNARDSRPLQIRATIRYTKEKRDSKNEGKFYACWNSNKLKANDPSHVFLNTKGKGQYIGSVLQAQGMQPGMTYFFEGDDSTAVDNKFLIHGTGSEDYFNGGWYAFPDRWSQRMSLPLHGALDYSLPFCRTGGYRFYLGDKISFEKDIFQSIEHGPVNNNIPVNYTSLAFYYCNTTPQTFLKPSNALSNVYIPDTMVMYPQLMNFIIWDNIAVKTSWIYNTGGQSFTFTATNESRLKISLDEIPNGNYELYADVTNNDKGCIFSLWQGQMQISDWINTGKEGVEERVPMLHIGEINLEEFRKSLTLQFKTDSTNNNFLLNRLVFVRKKK